MSFNDLVYLQKRAQEAREQARASADPRVQAIHLKFAAQYEKAARELQSEDEIRTSRDAMPVPRLARVDQPADHQRLVAGASRDLLRLPFLRIGFGEP